MIKVLVIEKLEFTGYGWWRCFRPLQLMRRKYHEQIDFVIRERDISPVEIGFYDAVMVLRQADDKTLSLLKAAKQADVPIIADCDDDLFNLPQTHPMFSSYEGKREFFRRIYGMADVIWVSTDTLLNNLPAGKERAMVVQNAVLPSDLPDASTPELSPNEPVTWLWRGPANQIDDLFFAQEWYQKQQSGVQPDKWIFHGYLPPFNHGKNVSFLPLTPDVNAYIEALQKRRLRILWKPLRPSRFNDSKSNIAWIEATMAGGVCVTNYAGKLGWDHVLPEFTRDDDKIRKLWAESKKAIIADFNLERTVEMRFDSIKKLCL